MDTSSSSSTSGGHGLRFGESATAARKEGSAGYCGSFQMPLHYPVYSREDYESMPEWQLDCILREYGLVLTSPEAGVEQKRRFAVGAFLWSRK
ncbi:hypothetical protein MLD38_033511 [Melastoma candidum]|uniref:Uncharacterized protein n=1 Tax=Melastoma candidum TaxID=119954 RepID=A0ACB9MAQ3_9MYRT|nr:hypothetical protein MLD38_033511 [Melastoma candidum]